MKTMTGVAVASLMVLSSVLVAGDELKSGLQVGKFVPAFNVRDITGPNKGKTLCYRCAYGDAPVVTIFTRKVDENVTSLVKQIDSAVGKNKDKQMKAFVVVLTADADKAEADLEKLAKDQKIENVPLTVFDGNAGPPKYELSKDAEVTVMMWLDSEVKVNHAYAAGKLDKKAVETLVGETKNILN